MTEVLGSIVPRLYTPPLVTGRPGPCGCGCALTPETSYGFAVADFCANVLGKPLWPWQRWLAIHLGELADGIPRFRRVIITVGRQCGKTELVIGLSLYWLFEQKCESILGTSTLTKYAKRPWMKAFNMACTNPELYRQLGNNPRRFSIRKTSGEESWWTASGCEYSVAASNSEGGRSMTNSRVIADELAKQYNYEAYSAAYYSMDALEDAQYIGMTTPDPKGIVYTDLRESAMIHMETGEGDETLGLFEWSAPAGADPLDPEALAAANPTIGRPGGKRLARVLKDARAAVAKGGELLRSFMTEVMCMELTDVDAAIDPVAWARSADPAEVPDDADVVLVFDVALSLQHASLYAAAWDDGRIRVEAVEAWDGPGCVDRAVRDIPQLVADVRPKRFGWLPSGPAAAAGARLADRSRSRPGRREWPPRGVAVEEVRGELTQVCMGFNQLVVSDRIRHPDDPLLTAQALAAVKGMRGDAWVFARRGEGDTDALYAAAGAAHLLQTTGPGLGSFRVVLPSVR